MSFLVKTLLGDNVVHPVENSRKGSSPQGEEGNKEESDSFRAPVQKLISRVLSCTVPQDRRDALKELNEYPDLPSVMDPSEVLRICDLLRNYPEDGEVVESSLAILSNVTDVSGYPTSGPVMVSQGDKEYVRDSFLHTLVEQVPLLLGHMKEGSFWSRFHAVQLLQRLQDYDPLSMDKHLLASQGISVLVDILSDNSHGGALRNEGLVLIAAITATNTELQTLLAFNNAFEKLFEVIREEGDLDGGVIVADCLTIAHNMLRGNKATQKLFCEMDCAGLICPLMDAIAEPVRIAGRRCNNATHRTSEGSDALGPKVILTPLSGVQNMIALTAISLLGCVLRDGKALSDGGASVQESFLRCGVLSPLASLALLGAVVDDSVRVEALRTLAALVEDSELVVEQFLKLQVVTFLQEGSVQYVRETSAMRAALHVLLGTADRVLQPSVAQVFHALFTAADRGEEVALALLRGFSPPPSTAISVVTAKEPMTDDCGAAIAAALFSASTHNDCSGKYYAALLLDRLLMFPASSELLLEGRGTEVQSTSTARGSKCPTGADANDVTVQPDATFTAFVDYVLKCFRGQGEMDLNTLSACFRALLRWVVCDNRTRQHFLGSAPYYMGFLQCACHDDGPVHVRFWSAVLCAAVCVCASSQKAVECSKGVATGDETEAASVPEQGSSDEDALLELFFNHVGKAPVFESLLFDVKATSPTWSEPPRSAFLRSSTALYDEPMKHMLLSVIKSFKDLCSSYNTVNDANESTPPLSEVDRAHGSTDPTATNGGDPGPSRSPPLALPTNVWMDNATQKPDNPPPPVVTLSVLEETVAAQREEYEHTLRGLNERNGVLESEVRTLEEQAKQDAMRYEEEMTRLEERHRLEVSALNENLKLLEGALEAKEEEHQTLAQSLNMLEEQLRAALTRCADESKEKALLRQELQSMTKERDHLFVLVAQIFEEWRGVTVNERPHPTDETIKDFEQQSAVTPLLAACSGANYKEGGNGEDLCDFAQPTQLRFSPTPLSHLVQDTFSNQEGPSHSVQYSSAAPTFEQIQDPLIDASANAFDGQVSPGPASNTVQDLYAALDGAPKHNIPQRSTFDEINLPDNTAKDVVPAQPSDCVLHTSRRAKPLTFNPFAGMGDGDDVLDL